MALVGRTVPPSFFLVLSAVLLSVLGLALPLPAAEPRSEVPDVPASALQERTQDPGEVILRAIRSVESGDTSVLAVWGEAAAPGRGGEEPVGSAAAEEAALGLATVAWITYRHLDVETHLSRLLDPTRPEDAFAPYAWIVLGESRAAQARLQAADSAFATAVQVAERQEMPRARAWGMIRLANLRARLSGDRQEALRLMASAEALLDPDDPFGRGQFHCARAGADPSGEWTTEEDARAGLAFASEAGIRRLHAACLHVLASEQIRQGRTTEALATFGEEQAEQVAIGDRSGRAATLQWAGYVLYTLGDYAASRAYLLEAVADGEASGNLSPVAWAYLSLSGIAQGLGDLETATGYLDRAEALLEQQGDQWGLLTLKGRRGAVDFAAGRLDRARDTYGEVLAVQESTGNALAVLTTQTSLLEVALAEGDLDAAEGWLASARRTAAERGLGDWAISLFYHDAEIALQRGDPAGARRALERFLIPGQFTIRSYRAQVRYAEALAMEGRVTEAADHLEAALDSLELWRSGLDASGLQRYAFQIGEYLPDPDLGVASVISVLARAGEVERAFDLEERQRARDLSDRMVLAEIGRRRGVEDDGGQEASFLLPSPKPLKAGEVIAGLPDAATVLVEFVTGRGGEPTTAFLVGRDGVRAVTLASADSLQRDIGLLRSLVESGEDHRPLAARLGAAVLGPVLDGLPADVASLALVPSGPLHMVPFDLLEPTAGTLLVERFAVSVVPSASILTRLHAEAGSATPTLLAVGDPALPPGQELPRLPGAAREARLAARFGNPGRLVLGAEASELFLDTIRVEDFGILHLAVHAIVNPSSASGTYLVLAPEGAEDGLVSPGEISQMRMGPALVVLSSCQTAGGSVIRGEGLQGLTAPFLQAGAHSVLVTGWPVEDRGGYRLMRDFYRGLAGGEPAGEALRKAKLASRGRGDPARVWGAYALSGDPTLRIAGLGSGRAVFGGPLGWAGILLGGLGIALLAARRWRRRALP